MGKKIITPFMQNHDGMFFIRMDHSFIDRVALLIGGPRKFRVSGCRHPYLKLDDVIEWHEKESAYFAANGIKDGFANGEVKRGDFIDWLKRNRERFLAGV